MASDWMELSPAICPTCGESAIGTIESVSSIAHFDQHRSKVSGNLLHSWNGSSTTLHDTSTTETDADGRLLVTCSNGHEWFAANLREGQTPVPTEPKIDHVRAISLDEPG